ncbi:hypothetical protein NPIL_72181 [Nephila pilipes]|uniref:Secreted protein n=1 Tax=Nephila pilipes TaxID=299642 RepID=A0A8X6TGS4_NEPPI|nr:hypothetical protein NPIL_72181 [Nephila pilipes]
MFGLPVLPLVHSVLLLVLLLDFGGLDPCLFIDLLDRPHLFLELHPPVLEPDLDLALRETQRMRDLDPPPARQVVVEVEFLL